jgi:hypothetical protein
VNVSGHRTKPHYDAASQGRGPEQFRVREIIRLSIGRFALVR